MFKMYEALMLCESLNAASVFCMCMVKSAMSPSDSWLMLGNARMGAGAVLELEVDSAKPRTVSRVIPDDPLAPEYLITNPLFHLPMDWMRMGSTPSPARDWAPPVRNE